MAKKKAAKKKKKHCATGYPELGKNVGAKVEDGVLFLAINLDADLGETPGGFRRIATTSGNIEVPGHPTIQLGLNCYDKDV